MLSVLMSAVCVYSIVSWQNSGYFQWIAFLSSSYFSFLDMFEINFHFIDSGWVKFKCSPLSQKKKWHVTTCMPFMSERTLKGIR